MKKIIFIITILLALMGRTGLNAQNTPTGTNLTSVPLPTLATLPTPYNSGANSGNVLTDPSNPKLNYSRVWIPQVPVTSLSGQLGAPDNIKVITKYFNGWGKTLQVNNRGGWSQVKDVIIPVDNRASLTKTTFLPYAATKGSTFQYSAFNEQRNYYNTTIPAEGGTSYTEQITPTDQSVRKIKNYSTGRSFVGQHIGTEVTLTWNEVNEVPILNFSGSQITFTGYYGANQIRVKTFLGQHNSTTKEYFDKDGRLVFKKVKDGGTPTNPTWMHTEYIYDDFGRLTCVVPPKIDYTGINILLNECYQYIYDKYGNISKKFTPGMALPEYFVYDRKQRLVLYRSPKMGEDDKYEFTIYDNAGRVILYGITNSNSSPATWQNDIETNNTPTSGTLLYYIVNGGSTSISTIASCEILTRNYYDTYAINFPSPYNSFSTAYSQYYRTDLGAVMPVLYTFAHGKLTRTVKKVIDANNNNLGGDNSTITEYYYDQQGRLIQTQSCIPWNGSSIPTTIVTYQYNFTGQNILTIIDTKGADVGVAGTVKQQTLQLVNYNYDILNGGRLKSITQKMDSEPWRDIANYFYDDMGRMSRELLGGVENRFYSYDISGKLTAINQNYVENGATSSNMPTTFGVELHEDHGFHIPRLDGKLSGIIWRGAGASPKRSYGYEYDQAGRLAHAEYREFTNSPIAMSTPNGPVYTQGENWNKQYTDYTATNMKYDKNGNMLSMTQVGVPVGGNEPMYMDVMGYFYGIGNRQTATVDAVPYNFHHDEFIDGPCDPYDPGGPVVIGGEDPPIIAGKGDGYQEEYFELGEPPATPTSSPCNDYVYDVNGNLTYDGNKKINISYNHLNLPVDVVVQNFSGNNSNQASTIHNIYNSGGTLLEKTITDNTLTPPKIDKYKYVGAYTYRNGKLVYVLNEKGRTAYVETPGVFEYDFFVKDHLGNVRTVVTAAERNGLDYVATHELASANLESSVFFRINEVRSPNPSPTQGNTRAELLNSRYDSTRIGASLLLSVMPGDAIDFSADYYWEQDSIPDTVSTSQTILEALFNTLSGGVGGYAGNEAFDSKLFERRFPNILNYPNSYTALKDAQTDPNRPRAYLNCLVFDKDMKLISEQSNILQVGALQSVWGTISLEDPIVLGQGGYVLVHTSNELNSDVFFDHIDVKFYKGQLKQEQHYYPYGLCIKEGDAPGEPNKFKYEGKLLQDELGLHLYDFHARQYDPQIGKFWGIDPMNQYPSGYTGLGNDPANLIDPSGMQTRGHSNELQRQSLLFGGGKRDEWGSKDMFDFDVKGENCGSMGAGAVGTLDVAAENEKKAEAQIKEIEDQELQEVNITASKNIAESTEKTSSGFWGAVLDGVQLGLDIVGLVPGLGEIADGINAGIYALRGDYENASLSLAAMIPIAGDVVTVAKWAKRADKAMDAAEAVNGGRKLLQRFNSAESLVESAGKLKRLGGGVRQGRITGNADDIFNGLSQQYGAKIQQVGRERFFQSGDVRIGLHNSASGGGTPTIHINMQGKLYKIRVEP